MYEPKKKSCYFVQIRLYETGDHFQMTGILQGYVPSFQKLHTCEYICIHKHGQLCLSNGKNKSRNT